MPRTRIMATLGPVSSSPSAVKGLVREGADAFRLNFSHGTHHEHGQRVRTVRRTRARVLADLQGPKIRVGSVPDGLELRTGSSARIDTVASRYADGAIPMPLASLKGIRRGSRIFIDDGFIILKVLQVRPPMLHCEVLQGGPLLPRKGANIPGATLYEGMTAKDIADLKFIGRLGVDYVSPSFIKTAGDVTRIRPLIGGEKLVAKIETQEALRNFDEILEASDGIMIARGDLGMETPIAELPVRQKAMIRKCNRAGVPVIVATQMLASMMHSPVPTRAEVSDVANAVLDGADVVMLSGETAQGAYPIESVHMMRRIIEATEKSVPAKKRAAF